MYFRKGARSPNEVTQQAALLFHILRSPQGLSGLPQGPPSCWASSPLSRFCSDFTFSWKPFLTLYGKSLPHSIPRLHIKAFISPDAQFFTRQSSPCTLGKCYSLIIFTCPVPGFLLGAHQAHHFAKMRTAMLREVGEVGQGCLPEKQRTPSTAEYPEDSPAPSC